MTSIIEEIEYLHGLLKHRDRWYIDISCPDIPEFQDIAEKAKAHADKKLSDLGTYSIFRRFRKWEKEDKIIAPEDYYYLTFLDFLAWDLGRGALKGRELDLYEESINLTVKFI